MTKRVPPRTPPSPARAAPTPPAPAAPRAAEARHGMGLHRPAVIVSLALHLGGFLLVVGVPRLLASGPDPGKVYIVDLVSLPGPAGPGPATPPPPAGGGAPAPQQPPKAAPQPPPPAKKPAEKAIVLPDRTAKKKPAEKPKPAPVKREEPPAPPKETASPAEPPATTPAATTPETGTPAAAPGTAPGPGAPVAGGVPGGPGATAGGGGGGEGTGGGGDAYTFYLALLKRNIESAWKRPVYTGDTTMSATVNLKISRAGRVLRLELSKPSGFEPLDRSLMTAVRAAEPFPPFPMELAMDSLAVQIVFDLTPEDAASPGD